MEYKAINYYFDVGDTDEGVISLVRGFFYGIYKITNPDWWNCDTLTDTHSVSFGFYYKKDSDDPIYLEDNVNHKEAKITFNVALDHEHEMNELFKMADELIKIDAGSDYDIDSTDPLINFINKNYDELNS